MVQLRLSKPMRCYAFFVLLCGVGYLGAQSDSFLTRKQILIQSLDSLEMVKQIQKRSGRPIDDLEKQSIQLRDSIDVLKQAAPAVVTASLSKRPFAAVKPAWREPINKIADRFRRFSHTPFDVIIVIIGGIALLSGGLLVLGIVRLLLRQRTRAQRPTKPVLSDVQSIAAPRRGDTAIRQIRDRIMHTVDSRAATPAPHGYVSPSGDAEIKAALILAAGRGVSASELARQYHMSVDQVSLILTVAQKKKKASNRVSPE